MNPNSVTFDGNGNIIAYVDMGTGAKSATYEYNAFGETLIADGPAAELFPFKFSTRYTDQETGIVMFPLRPYLPWLGRFGTNDPIEEQGGVNRYAFVVNNPVNFFDALGQRPIAFYFDAFIHGDRGSWLPEPGPNVANYYFKTDERGFGVRQKGQVLSLSVQFFFPSATSSNDEPTRQP